jgi:dihydroorotate dehydrogenase
MGFNNEGVDALAGRLLRHGRPGKTILGGNIGKNKNYPQRKKRLMITSLALRNFILWSTISWLT